MKKFFCSIFFLLVICTNFFYLQAQYPVQSNIVLSMWPDVSMSSFVYNIGTGAHDLQSQGMFFGSNYQDNYNFSTPQNASFSSLSLQQDPYQQHRQFVLYHAVSVPLQGKIVHITPEDINLINKICADNPHKNADDLRRQLAESSAFNAVQHFLKHDQLYNPFGSDIFIDPAHFKELSSSDYRMKRLFDAAEKALDNRYTREQEQLKKKHAAELAAVKNRSKSEQKALLTGHEKEYDDLKAQYKKEKKHPCGQKSNINLRDAKQQEKYSHHQSIKKQQLKAVLDQHQQILSCADVSDDVEFQQIMQQRSQALQTSLHDQKISEYQIKINSQTAGFLQAQGIDATQFAQINGLPIQHQLTGELVHVLDGMADYALHHHELYQKNLINYCTNLALLTQQSNQQGALQQTVQGANCCHGIQNYLEGMVAGAGQAYQKFQTAVHYFQPILEEYALAIEQHVVQSGAVIQGLEAIATAGLIAAPTATVAATGIMIGVVAVTIAPICLQGLANIGSFGGACLQGDWKKIEADLDDFKSFMTSPETVGHIAGFATGTKIPTPNLNLVVEHVVSLRPVITSVQQASGKAAAKLYVMTKNEIQQVYRQSIELLQSPEFMNFNFVHKKIWGCNFFKLFEQEQFALMPAFASGIENNLLSSADQAAVTQLFTQAQGSVIADVVKSGAKFTPLNGLVESNYAFLQTNIGTKMLQAITKLYEETMLVNIAKQYEKLVANQAPQDVIDLFCACHQKSLIPDSMSKKFLQLHKQFENKYPGLPEFSSKNPYLTMQMRHIFYPSIQPKLDKMYQGIEKIALNGFHHDELSALEQSGLFTMKNKIYGQPDFGAEECVAGILDWGDGIITQETKTFFPSSWSQEQVVQVVFEAAQKKIEEIVIKNIYQRKFECLGRNGLLIDIVFNSENVIISAYPSMKNF